MLKVAYLSPVGDLKGGAETSLVDLLNNGNVEAVLVVPREGELSSFATKNRRAFFQLNFGKVERLRRPVKVRSALPVLFDWFVAAIELRRLAKKEHFDIIHSNGLKAHLIACLCRLIGGPPTVIHLHDIPLQRRERLVWRAMGFFSDLVLIVSRPCWPTKGELPNNVKVLFNGLDTDSLPKLEPAQGDIITVGFCGRLHPYKGVHLLIRWVGHVRSNGIDIRLLIRGEGAPEHEKYIRYLKAEVEQLELSDVVQFEGKKYGLKEIYSGLDVVVVPSYVADALPRSIMEAMGLGLVVIAYPSGGIVYQIEDGVDGFLVESADAFLHKIEILKSNPGISDYISNNARLKVEEVFTIQEMYQRLEHFYRLL